MKVANIEENICNVCDLQRMHFIIFKRTDKKIFSVIQERYIVIQIYIDFLILYMHIDRIYEIVSFLQVWNRKRLSLTALAITLVALFNDACKCNMDSMPAEQLQYISPCSSKNVKLKFTSLFSLRAPPSWPSVMRNMENLTNSVIQHDKYLFLVFTFSCSTYMILIALRTFRVFMFISCTSVRASRAVRVF